MLLKSNFNSPTLATITANIIEANNLVNIFIRNLYTVRVANNYFFYQSYG